MEGKCARIKKTVPIDPHRPNIVTAAGYRVNAITVCARIRAWYNRPCSPVPMHDQGALLSELSIIVFAGSPHVVATPCHSINGVNACVWVGNLHMGPSAASPVQRERHTRPARRYPVGLHGAPRVPAQRGRPTWLGTVIVVHPDGPNIVATAGCSENVIVQIAWVRAWH